MNLENDIIELIIGDASDDEMVKKQIKSLR